MSCAFRSTKSPIFPGKMLLWKWKREGKLTHNHSKSNEVSIGSKTSLKPIQKILQKSQKSKTFTKNPKKGKFSSIKELSVAKVASALMFIFMLYAYQNGQIQVS